MQIDSNAMSQCYANPYSVAPSSIYSQPGLTSAQQLGSATMPNSDVGILANVLARVVERVLDFAFNLISGVQGRGNFKTLNTQTQEEGSGAGFEQIGNQFLDLLKDRGSDLLSGALNFLGGGITSGIGKVTSGIGSMFSKLF